MPFSRLGLHAAGIVALLWLRAASLDPVSADTVSARGSFDDKLCTIPSSVDIEEGSGCEKADNLAECDELAFWNPYYRQETCSDSREAYLKSTYGSSALFMIEYYEDINCKRLSKTDVYLVDGKCHNQTLGSTRVWTAKDKSLAALLDCGDDEWPVLLHMNFSVNTGACVPESDHNSEAVKYVLVGEPPAVSLVLPALPASSGEVGVWVGNDDSACKKPSMVGIAEGGCKDTKSWDCEAVDVGGDETHYWQSFCSESRDAYLQSTFGDTPLFVVEHFNDNKCGNLVSSDVYLADGQCHYIMLGAMKVLISKNNSIATLLASGSCESGEWAVDDELVVTVNPPNCIVQNECRMTSMRYVLISPVNVSEASSILHSQIVLALLVWAIICIVV